MKEDQCSKQIATEKLMRTFRRFGIAKANPLAEGINATQIEMAIQIMAKTYGSPSTAIINPQAFEGLKKYLDKKNDK